MTCQIKPNEQLKLKMDSGNMYLHIKPQQDDQGERIENILGKMHGTIREFNLTGILVDLDSLDSKAVRNIGYMLQVLASLRRKFKVAIMVGHAENEKILSDLKILLSDYVKLFDFKISPSTQSNVEWIAN